MRRPTAKDWHERGLTALGAALAAKLYPAMLRWLKESFDHFPLILTPLEIADTRRAVGSIARDVTQEAFDRALESRHATRPAAKPRRAGSVALPPKLLAWVEGRWSPSPRSLKARSLKAVATERRAKSKPKDFPADASGQYLPCPICGRVYCDHTLDERGDGT